MARSVNMTCECVLQIDGSHTLVIRADGLSAEEYDRLAIYMHDPMVRMLQFATAPEHDHCDCDACVTRRAAYTNRGAQDRVSTNRRLNS